MTKFRIAINNINAWQIRIVTLSFLVLFIGSSSQILVNALAAGTESEVQSAYMTTVVLDTPTVTSTPTMYTKIRRAGVDTFGGYTVMGKK